MNKKHSYRITAESQFKVHNGTLYCTKSRRRDSHDNKTPMLHGGLLQISLEGLTEIKFVRTEKRTWSKITEDFHLRVKITCLLASDEGVIALQIVEQKKGLLLMGLLILNASEDTNIVRCLKDTNQEDNEQLTELREMFESVNVGGDVNHE